jgi:hypothetical protein
MFGMTLSGKYWYEDWIFSMGFIVEEDGTIISHVVYSEGYLNFATSDISREKSHKQPVDRFNVELYGLSHTYLDA